LEILYLRDRKYRLYIILLYLEPSLQFPPLDMMMMMVLQLALLHTLLQLISPRQLRIGILVLALELVTHAPYDLPAVPASAYLFFLAGFQQHRHYFLRGPEMRKMREMLRIFNERGGEEKRSFIIFERKKRDVESRNEKL